MKALMCSCVLLFPVTLLVSGCAQQSDESAATPTNTAERESGLTRKSDMGEGAVASGSEHHYFHKTEKPHAAEWTYTGDTGPSHWGDLSPKYVLAKEGKQQSPINLVNPDEAVLPPLEISYRPARINLIYNGHTVEELEEAGSSLTVGGNSFALKQFHFHAPSEHTIDGKHAAMEMHLVHLDDAGRIAVVGVMIQEGAENPAFDPVWDYLPTELNKKVEYGATIDAADLLPGDKRYFHYVGSLTTPPCSQGVNWYVLLNPVEMSREQIDKFTAIINHNNRPVQPLNDRVVTRSAK